MINEIKTFDERKLELVKIGKDKGFITYEELANALKGLDLDADSLDDLYNLFNENNIAIVSSLDNDAEEDGDKLLLDDNDLTKDLTINDRSAMEAHLNIVHSINNVIIINITNNINNQLLLLLYVIILIYP